MLIFLKDMQRRIPIKIHNIFLQTFILVFLAELGDKTQIASFSLSAQSGNPISVIIGVSLGLVLSSLLAVLLGNWLSSKLPPALLRIVSGGVFIIAGIAIVFPRFFL